MSPLLLVGIIISVGFIFGELAQKVKLPKVTGYILAGALLDPDVCAFIPADFPNQTNIITNIALAFITFSIGGSIYYPTVKKAGKSILWMTLLEAEFAFFAIIFVFVAIAPLFIKIPGATLAATFVPLALLIGSLGSPTDPSATLAIKQQYNPTGDVSVAMLSVAAFDDVLAIINYSIAVVVATALCQHESFLKAHPLWHSFLIIGGSVLMGVAFGLFFNFLTAIAKKKTPGVLVVVLLALLTLCFGLSTVVGVDELLSLMVMGIVVVNFNKIQDKIFGFLEGNIDELVFILFFTLSGMHLNPSVLITSGAIILLFLIARFAGKYFGTALGATIGGASDNVKKYTAGGLVPQGGIVIGLALMMSENPVFRDISDVIINVIIATTVINEFIGPICTKIALKKAGEIA